MIYRRSGTVMDRVSQFFPPNRQLSSYVQRSRVTMPDETEYLPGKAASSRLSGLGAIDDPSMSLDFSPGAGDLATVIGSDSAAMPAYDIGLDPGQAGAPAPASGGIFDSIKSFITPAKEAFVAYQSASQQKQIIDINAERAKRGLSPISASSIAPQANVGLSADTKALISKVALGAGALFLFSVLRRKRR